MSILCCSKDITLLLYGFYSFLYSQRVISPLNLSWIDARQKNRHIKLRIQYAIDIEGCVLLSCSSRKKTSLFGLLKSKLFLYAQKTHPPVFQTRILVKQRRSCQKYWRCLWIRSPRSPVFKLNVSFLSLMKRNHRCVVGYFSMRAFDLLWVTTFKSFTNNWRRNYNRIFILY